MTGPTSAFFEPVAAKLQADVGAFLALKQRLLGARLLPVAPEQQGALQQSYATQLDLEGQLPPVLQAVARLQAGQMTFTDSITAGTFLTAMELHLHRTQDLLAGLPAPPTTTVNWNTVLLWGGGAAAVWMLMKGSSNLLLWGGIAVGGYLLWRNWTPTPVTP